MEYKNEKDKGDGKEPIEKILSDLDGLLNKMPSILSGIKMPDIMRKNIFDCVKDKDIMSDNAKASGPQENLNTDEISAQQSETSAEGNDYMANEAEKKDSDPSSNLDFMAFENDLQAQEDVEQADLNETENPARTGFPPFEAVPSVSALDKEEDLQEEDSNQDSDAPDIEALMKLAENEADSASADTEQEVETESNANLQGGVMDLNEEDKDIESGNEDIQNNQDVNPEVQPEVNLNPLDGNIADNEPDDEKTIIASPEDFKTMLSESSSSDAEQAMEDKPSDAEQAMEDKPQENIKAEDIQFESTVEEAPQAEEVQPEGLVNNEEPAVETSVDNEQAIEDKPQENIQAEDIQFEPAVQEEVVGEEPAIEQSITEEPVIESILETAEQLSQGLQNSEASEEESGAISEEAGAIGATSEGLELNPSIELSSEADDEKTIVLEPNHSTFSDNAGQSEQDIPGAIGATGVVTEAMEDKPSDAEQAMEDKPSDAEQAMEDKPAEAGNLNDANQTLSDANPVEESLSLVQPESLSEDVKPEEAEPDASEETIMAAPGDNPSQTNRAKYTLNINELIERQVPEGIPNGRIKTLVFLYTTTEEALCAEILNTMDAICLKSETKPMFIKRPVVKVCEPHLRGDSAQALVVENGAMGLVCIGDLPSEMIYDIENVFNIKTMFLRHIEKEKFSRELIVDMVVDLILI